MSKHQVLRIAGVVSVAGFIVVFIGNGCGQGFETHTLTTNTSAGQTTGSNLTGSATNPENDYPVIPGAKTVSTVYSTQVLNHLTACVGVTKPSDPTVQMYEQKKGAISTSGSAGTMTAPMMMAIASIAGEVCDDLIDQEVQSGMRIFQGVNMSANTLPSSNVLGDIVVRMALSCWQRNETSSERQKIVDMVQTSVGMSEPGAARKASLMVCTAVLASLDSILN